MTNKYAYTYILANKKHGTLYVGVSSNLTQRMYEHKNNIYQNSFTSKYKVHMLVWYTSGEDITSAIELEKKIKNRNRAWKINLIERTNPEWLDLSLNFM